MFFTFRRFALGLVCWVIGLVAPVASGQEATKAVFNPQAFLDRYCFKCHDSEVQKGDRRLDDLPLSVGADVLIAERWQEVMHQIQLGEMPPPKKTQPSAAERQALFAWIEGEIQKAQAAGDFKGGRVVQRRLNRKEYLFTIRDLFGFSDDFDPTKTFPAEEEADGFRNVGSVLRTSQSHIEEYLIAADKVLDMAYDLADVDGPPKSEQWRESADTFKAGNLGFGTGVVDAEKSKGAPYIFLSSGIRSYKQIYDAKLLMSGVSKHGVSRSGWYEIEVDAAAVNRHHPYGKDLMQALDVPIYKDLKLYYDDTQPMVLGIGCQKASADGSEWKQIVPNFGHLTALADDKAQKVRARIWLDRGMVPYLSFVNGPPKGTKGQFVSTTLYRYDKSVPKIDKKVWENLAERAKRDELYYHLYKGPEIHVKQWAVSGPLAEGRPEAARKLLFGGIQPDATAVPDETLSTELQRIASLLFRRQVAGPEVEVFAAEVKKHLDGKTSYAEAARPVFKALLCSSEFLFLTEPEAKVTTVTPMQFASRLAYFLNSGPPDDALRVRAGQGFTFETLRAEVDRLLNSPKADRMVQRFTSEWLGLTKLGLMPPGEHDFPLYHIYRLENAMKAETFGLVGELIRTNRPVTGLVNADFTYVNEGLGKLYGLPEVSGDELRRVALPAGFPRVGVLRHGSVLTVTANGVETSPVKRGVWLLEKVFGTPPPPPPPNVPGLEPDIRGATTVREQLQKHRSIASCAECHQKIDPLGFALEAYDPVGRLRTAYVNGAKIDSNGEYRGVAVRSAEDIRDYMLKHPELLAHNVAERLMTFALGRKLTLQDKPEMRRIVEEWGKRGLGMRELVHLITSSELMRTL
ncbi:MAG: DUF1588 domain-containing protein [Verrucomicrobiota bacterium]